MATRHSTAASGGKSVRRSAKATGPIAGAQWDERVDIATHATYQIDSIAAAIITFAKKELPVDEQGALLALATRTRQLNGIVMAVIGDDAYDKLPLTPFREVLDATNSGLTAEEVEHA